MIVLPPLPPAPPLPYSPTADEHDRYLRWVAEARYRADLESMAAWREASKANMLDEQECRARRKVLMEALLPVVGPTLDRIADAWDALDAQLGRLATALGAPAPAPPAPPLPPPFPPPT